MSVNDGSTGLPADDLIVHDGALMHLLVIGPTGELWHLHPIRTAPGTYEVQLRLPAVGHYAVSAEFARRGGGIQHVRSATGLTVADGSTRGGVPALPAELAPRGPGTRTIDGVPVRLTAPSPRAGEASTLTARVGDTRTLQPWLGMVGHMIVVGPLDRADATSPTRMGQAAQGAPVWAHAHSMGGDMSGDPTPGMAGAPDHDMAAMRHGAHSGGDEESMDSMSGLMPLNGDSPADETVAAYGPDASFVYTFSRPGYYRVWIQAERDSAILTVPYLLRVSPAAGAAK
ncbi:hypothetical protein [Streptomyces rapamycinicus]|uniref:hypothetical protein n=1 Tax=Streptomyces rapamycinicus TaxID=1226757 RepID=UPI0032D92BA7